MNKSGKFLILGLIWLLFCIPVVTIGSSTCAAFYVALKILKNEDDNLWKLFVKGFKEDFLQGVFVLIFSIISLGAAGYFWYWIIKNDNMNLIMGLLALIASWLVVSINVCVYPIISRYKNKFSNLLRNAFAITFTYYKKITKMALFVVIEIAIEVLLFKLSLIAGLISLLFWPCTVFFTVSFYIKDIFYALENPKTYDDEDESEEE